ncbi:lipopolysaccharide heptosyltransferase family protein, partial [Vibrio cholerae]
IGQSIIEPNAPYLTFPAEQLAAQRSKLAEQLELNPAKAWLFVHAGSGGSANNLSLAQYCELVTGVMDEHKQVVLTAGPGEEEKAP